VSVDMSSVDMSTVVPFGDRLLNTFQKYGHLCVGIDPHAYLLTQWGLPDSARGVKDFGLYVVEAMHNGMHNAMHDSDTAAGIVKPQVAFFERHGSAGLAALEEVMAAARAAGFMVIADAKRGDIGTSVEAYGQAWLTPGSSLEADALTVCAYQGLGSLKAILECAEQYGKGVFVLAATSNPEAARVQTAQVVGAGISVARAMIDDVNAWNAQNFSHQRIGAVGYVFGATVNADDYGIRRDNASVPIAPVLVPGFGYQGRSIDDASVVLGRMAHAAVISESRSLLSAGKDGLQAAIIVSARKVAKALG
jgi:orotidine-5'-phosphate decarboxylase